MAPLDTPQPSTGPSTSTANSRGGPRQRRGRGGYHRPGQSRPGGAQDPANDGAEFAAGSASEASRRRNRRRKRGGRGSAGGVTDETSSNTAPAAESAAAQTQLRRGRGHAGTQPSRQERPARMVNGRAFGGQLTNAQSNEDAMSEGGVSLQADAAEFTPGSAFTPHQRPPTGPSGKAKRRRASMSVAPDLSTRLHEDIDHGVYECTVCTDDITRRHKIWSCHTCWTVFHFKCIKTWSARSLAAQNHNRPDSDDDKRMQTWRCPGCNLPKEDLPTTFKCWCEKEIDPPRLPGIPPFSCGQTCNRSRGCPHPCSKLCHAGPCEPCSQMGPMQTCFCGTESKTRKCLDTDYDNGWSCGQVCNELMPCGEHYCGRPCHEGLCGACEVPIDATCYCGQERTTIPCCDRGYEHTSKRTEVGEDGTSLTKTWIGIYKCTNICNRNFDCGKHKCEKPCHSQDAAVPHCPRSPNVVTHCPCGKTLLEKLTDSPRMSCDVEIPLCDKPCSKKLACGHACIRICHTGDCSPCLSMADIPCRCGRITVRSMCPQGEIEAPMCMRTCRTTLNCGRHECGEHCCTGERKAAERIATKKKLGRSNLLTSGSRLTADQEYEAEHICTRVCGKPLKCGNHTCQELCHRGPCNSCREAIFHEISCHCGRTIIQPPLPCGTQPPPCRFECERPKSCGHPQVSHFCHTDEESCPKCPFLTTKPCLCGKNQLKNIPCWNAAGRCGEDCGKKLKCGYHRCRKTCHAPGECEDADGSSCQQVCGKEKSCGHPCSEPCHSPSPCSQKKPCDHKIFITCLCQRSKQETRCGVSRTSPAGNATKALACDEECLRLERNRKLQLALAIPPDHEDGHIPYSADTINMYLARTSWSAAQEKLLRAFAADPDARRHRFAPMRREQRAFVHALAQDFGFDSESMDPEPHRHVALFKTPRFVGAPMKTLVDCVRIRQMQGLVANPGASTPSNTVGDKGKARALANVVPSEPYNALLLSSPQFGLTIEDLRRTFAKADDRASKLHIAFLPSDEVLITTSPSAGDPTTVAALLSSLVAPLNRAIRASSLGGSLSLCVADGSQNVVHCASSASGPNAAESGWSQVAKSAPARKMQRPQLLFNESRSGFAVLGRKKPSAVEDGGMGVGRKVKKEAVVDDWEVEEERVEMQERSSGGSGDEGQQLTNTEVRVKVGEETRVADEAKA